jgi:putative endopeptidase
VLAATNAAMGEALGRLYVERAFPPEAKQRAESMVADLLAVMRERLETADWMSEVTRREALLKLEAFGTKIGYPDAWRDWSGLETARDSYVENTIRANQFDFDRQLSKIGQQVDPREWGMPPQVVNAYYHPLRNEIVFPAGILQPPFFDETVDDALNYGGMGAVIGHEITHGFDDSGARFDAEGRLRNWWTPEDQEEFQKRAQVLVEQFYGYYVADGLAVNGELTLGENIADLGGLSIAYEALQRRTADTPDPLIGGLPREQRFFLAWARAWRQNAREEFLKRMVHTDPHAPAQFRAIGAPSNMPEFARAFGLEEGQPMLRPAEERARIW